MCTGRKTVAHAKFHPALDEHPSRSGGRRIATSNDITVNKHQSELVDIDLETLVLNDDNDDDDDGDEAEDQRQ